MPRPYLLLGLSMSMLIVLIGWLVLADHRATRVAVPVDGEINLEQQLQLLSHKVVVLSARQSDEQALRRELLDLKEKMRRIEEVLDRRRREADRVDTKPGAGAAITPGGVYPNPVDSSRRRMMRSTRMHGVINSCVRMTGGCALAIVTLSGEPALACGESLFHVGKGVMFRDYAAPIPGKILIVARSEGEIMMVERLAAAGHDMHIVADARELGTELRVTDFDVVVTLFKQRELAAKQIEENDSQAAYLPVAEAGTEEEGEILAVTPNPLSTDDSVKRFLLAIHRTLKARKA